MRALLMASVLAATSLAFAPTALPARERLSFDAGWRFHRGEAPDEAGRAGYETLRPWIVATRADLIADPTQRAARPGGEPAASAVSFVQPGFDDSGWTRLDLPHDWAIAGPFDQALPGETAKLPWQGAGWYRKTFALTGADVAPGRRTALQIDGAMAYSAIWCNGRLVGGWPCGYTSYQLDLTPYLKSGDNVVAIRLDNPPNSSRWYPGSGIHRHTWLIKTGDARIRADGIFVSTPRVSPAEALVNIDVHCENLGADAAGFVIRARIHILDPDDRPAGEPVAAGESMPLTLDPARSREGMRSIAMTLAKPRLWDLDAPNRYVAIATLERDGGIVDEARAPFGIRSARFDADKGFLLNGRRVVLQGVCLHHDLGALGAAINTRALERQIEILQDMGCNAIRTSHNPPAPEFLDLCDRMGVLVIDEAFDCWRRGKKWIPGVPEFDPSNRYFDYAAVWDDWHERDLRSLIRRDRNHPSVIAWSIGNEVIEQWFADGWKLGARLAGIAREEDRTRAVTAGFNNENAGFDGFQTALDAIGFNYKTFQYGPQRESQPHIAVYGAETASTLSTRGEYFFPVEPENKRHGRVDFHVSSYDLSAADWANIPDVEFARLDDAPWAAGEFVWTGFDYLGEPTPYNSDSTNLLNFSDPAQRARVAAELEKLGRIAVPSRSSYFGIIDLAGFPKDRFYLYQARWRPELRMAHILPHWNWPDRAGKVTPVHVYSSADEAELFLNGRSLGRRLRGPREYRFRWDDVIYEPGELKVVTHKDGEAWATAARRTAGPAAAIALAPDRAELRADGADLSFVTVRITDANGALAPRAADLVRFTLEGPGDIIAVDNGDPTSFEPFQATARKAFNGLALVIVRTRANEAGAMTLAATAPGLKPAKAALRSVATW